MSRSVAWRRTCTDAASWHQDEALSATIYILREIGPTGFLLKDDSEPKNVRVFVGDPHRCSCAVFAKERDLCKHLCWVLMKKFRVSRDDEVSWQLGLVEREINDLLRGSAVHSNAQQRAVAATNGRKVPSADSHQTEDSSGSGLVAQRDISSDDICPVCQEELLAKHKPVTYCRHGCGNSVHIKCMTVWAEHQLRSTGKPNVECPFCRVDFGPLSTLQAELRGAASYGQGRSDRAEHAGVVCQECHQTPIVGKCYKCSTCTSVYLCQTCFNKPAHSEHLFEYKEKPTQRWRKAPDRQAGILPDAVVSNLMTREISDEDYELLLQLDNNGASQPSDLTEATVALFPLLRVKSGNLLLGPGQQCRICLRGYAVGDVVRRLPCRHRFHRACVDDWLLHRHPTCPVDGIVYSNESVRMLHDAEKCRRQQPRDQQVAATGGLQLFGNTASRPSHTVHLEVPGISVLKLQAPVSRPLFATGDTNLELGFLPPENADEIILDESGDVAANKRTAQIFHNRSTLASFPLTLSDFSNLPADAGGSEMTAVIPRVPGFPISVSINRRTKKPPRPHEKVRGPTVLPNGNRAPVLPPSRQLSLDGISCTTADLLDALGPTLSADRISTSATSIRSFLSVPAAGSRQLVPVVPSIPSSHVMDDVYLQADQLSSSGDSPHRSGTREYRVDAGPRVKSTGRGSNRLRLRPLYGRANLAGNNNHAVQPVPDSLYIGNDPNVCPADLVDEAFPRLRPVAAPQHRVTSGHHGILAETRRQGHGQGHGRDQGQACRRNSDTLALYGNAQTSDADVVN